MSDSVEIIVTHVDSPSNFYLKFVSEKDNICREERKRIDHAIKKLVCQKSSSDTFIPAVNSIVGFFHFKWLQWVRAKVKEKQDSGAYLLFLLDHGHEIINGDLKRFIELPEEMKTKSRIVQRGSLGLRPCERVKDRKTGDMVTTPVRYYENEAIAIMKKLKEKDFQNVSKTFFEYKETHSDGTLIGDVTVKTMQETYSLRKLLMSKGLAINEQEDDAPEPQSAPTAVAVANFEKIIEAVCPNIPSKLEHKSPVEIAAGVPLELLVNQRKQVQVTNAQPTKPRARVEPPANARIKREVLTAIPPSDIIVFGHRLLPPFSSIESANFCKTIKEQLRNNTNAMNKVQMHCWPQIAEGRSMVIIGKSKSELTSSYLPPILDALQRTQEENCSKTAIGPIAIIITKSSSDIKRIAQLSSRCTGKLDVVELYGADSKITEVMNGCDLLVATISAFSRMIDGIPFKIFDNSRIKHVVFDCADVLLEPFNSEINEVIRKCTHGRLRTEINPQIVITANNWIKDIEPKLMSLIHQENLIICVEDFVEAAAYVKCFNGVGMKYLAGTEEKILKLMETLQTESYKSLRTIVVTNDDNISRMLVQRLSKICIYQISLAEEVNWNIIKNQWLHEKNENFTLLVTSDSALKQMELKNVQNLIHFSIPKSWESFSRRFASMVDQFYKQIANKNVKVAQTTVLLDDDNNLEFTQLVKFMNLRSINVSPLAINAVKLINDHEEVRKIERNIAICNNVWMFGECNKQACSFRHTFGERDKPSAYIPTDSFIKFDFVSMKTPTNYTIKIRSRLSGINWLSWDEKNSKIEKTLEKDLQEFFNDPSNCKPANIVIGELCALKREKKWFRCRVIEKKLLGIVEVCLIDVGKTIPWLVAKLIELPDCFKRLDLLCHNLQILNLVPFDHEEFYDAESKKVVGTIVEEAAIGSTFMCKVRMAVQDIMFTDSFDAKDDSTGSLRLRLKSKLLKKNICSIDESVEEKLRKLFLGFQPKEEKIIESSQILPREEHLTSVQAKKPQESWKSLSWDSYYDVNVKHFKNPESFLIVLDASDNKFNQKAIADIAATPVTIPLEEVEPGVVCAVRKETTTCRGKVVKVNKDAVEVLLVDYGDIVACNKSNLFVLPDELITKITFQTIHCRLMGVRPKYNMTIWPSKQIAAVQKLIQEHKKPLKMIVKKKNQREKDDLMEIGMNSYDVTLAYSSGEDLSDIAVSKKFVDEAKDKKQKQNKNETESNISEKNDIDLLAAMLNQMIIDASEEKIIKKESSDDESDEEEFKDASDEADIQFEPSPFVNVAETPTPPVLPSRASSLTFLHKHPKIEWRQNEELIYLLISAIDCKDYGLEVTDTSMTVGIKYLDGRYEKTSLQLYSTIDYTQLSHELRGLNIIVRLVKKNFNEWPRLTVINERSQFIKYSKEKISTKAEELVMNKCEKTLEEKYPDYRFALPDGYSDTSDCENLCLSDSDEDF